MTLMGSALGQYCTADTCAEIAEHLQVVSYGAAGISELLNATIHSQRADLTELDRTLTSKMEKQHSSTSAHLATTRLVLGITAGLVAILLVVVVWLCNKVNELSARNNNGGAVLLND